MTVINGVQPTATASLTLGAIVAALTTTQTITVNGAVVGDPVLVIPPTAIEAGVMWVAWVSAANTVTLRVVNNTLALLTPAVANWTVIVLKCT